MSARKSKSGPASEKRGSAASAAHARASEVRASLELAAQRRSSANSNAAAAAALAKTDGRGSSTGQSGGPGLRESGGSAEN